MTAKAQAPADWSDPLPEWVPADWWIWAAASPDGSPRRVFFRDMLTGRQTPPAETMDRALLDLQQLLGVQNGE